MPSYGSMGGQQRGYGYSYGDEQSQAQTQDPGVQLAPAMVAPDVQQRASSSSSGVAGLPGQPAPVVVVQPSSGGGNGGGFSHPPAGGGGGGGGIIPQFPEMARHFDGFAKRFPWWMWLILGWGTMWYLQKEGWLRKMARSVAA